MAWSEYVTMRVNLSRYKSRLTKRASGYKRDTRHDWVSRKVWILFGMESDVSRPRTHGGCWFVCRVCGAWRIGGPNSLKMWKRICSAECREVVKLRGRDNAEYKRRRKAMNRIAEMYELVQSFKGVMRERRS